MVQKFSSHLTQLEAEKRLAKYGANLLPEPASSSVFIFFLRQFKSPFIYVLFAAAAFSLGLGQHINAIFIVAVLLINAIIGTIQEFSAEKNAKALKKMVPSFTTVIRDSKPVKITTKAVVVGDLVQLVPGDKIPADAKLQRSYELQINESMLTGESTPVHKVVADDALGKPRSNNFNTDQLCFAGTIVVRGRGFGTVIATGANTEIGKIAADVDEEQTKPPLLLRIEEFTLRITYGILLLIALMVIITLARGDEIGSVFLLAVALAVSAIPEGLPAAITIALAIGMRNMAKVKVIIRNLLAVEALGSCTYIASDKTGTLTVNEMTAKQIQLCNGAQYQVTGDGLDLHGIISPMPQDDNADNVRLLCLAGALANESYLQQEDMDWTGQGDMVDVALLVLAHKYGIDYQEARKHYPELAQIPYESEHAYSASVNRVDGKNYLFVKGSVEKLIFLCQQGKKTLPAQCEHIEGYSNAMASQGFRVLGIGFAILDEVPNSLQQALTELKFLGIVGMIDPLRSEVKQAVTQCKGASIKVAMITGDHPQTAISLAQQAGIAEENMQAVTGEQLATAYTKGKQAFSECVQSSRVFARVSPHQKKQIVEQLMIDGDFVGVTGDGVNDAPALNHAHVGIAMGLRGTDVARESAHIILTDDHFASIVQGIKHGRIVYNNIRKVIFLLVSTGAAEIILVLLSLLFGMPLPLLPLQLLWLNLVTNGIQDVALAFEPEEGNELKQAARSPNEPIFNRLMVERVLVNALAMGCLAFILFKWLVEQGVIVEEARNMTLLLMVLFENVHVFNSRSETSSMFKQNLFGNKFLLFGMLTAQAIHIAAMYTPGLKTLLQIEPVTLAQWSWLLAIALVLIIVDELHKVFHQVKN